MSIPTYNPPPPQMPFGYSYNQPPPAKRRRRWPWIVAIVVLAFIAFISCASALGSSSTSPQPAPQAQQTPAPPPAFPGATDSDVVAQAGKPIVVDGLTLTASPLKSVKGAFGGEPVLCTTVTYKNAPTAKQGSYNGGFDWKLQDPNGTIVMPGISAAARPRR